MNVVMMFDVIERKIQSGIIQANHDTCMKTSKP